MWACDTVMTFRVRATIPCGTRLRRERTMPEAKPAQDPDADEATTAGADGADEAPVFENRAARRAKGKGSSQPQPHTSAERSGGRGPAQGPRQWSTRRSG
jgi:hypothetical protein